jgi:trans-aconitate 2-methyltransferase
MAWNPGQYLRFSDDRLRPALDLLGRIPLDSPRLVYDLGCGTGNVTRAIAKRWDSARVVGLDNSLEMLARAQAEPGTVEWVHADIESWRPAEAPDLIFSNATLHWVEGHDELLPRLIGYLGSGGCLAVQMPESFDSPSHRLMRQTLAEGGPGGRALGSEQLRRAVGRRWVEAAEFYYDLLSGRALSLDIWASEYLHVLEGEDPVLAWVKGTALRPVLDGLSDSERELFLGEYAPRLREAYPAKPDGRTLYPFRRLFIVAVV